MNLKSFIATLGLSMVLTQTYSGIIPTSVQKAFQQKFPEASKVKWDKENSHEYEATFLYKGKIHSANFKDTGEWLETESTYPFEMLPEKVKTAFNSKHKTDAIKAVAIIQNSSGSTKYEIEIRKGIKIEELFFNSEGNQIN